MRARITNPEAGNIRYQRTKIVGTIGPASTSEAVLRELITHGLDVFRLNFSHGDHQGHAEVIERIRRIENEIGVPVMIFCDLQGPKLRIGRHRDRNPIRLIRDQRIEIRAGIDHSDGEWIATPLRELPQMVSPGSRILMADGSIELRVEVVEGERIDCVVVIGGLLAERQGINLPGTVTSSPGLTAKDLDDLLFCLGQPVDAIALSFVRSADDIRAARERMDVAGMRLPVIAKIERPEALAHITDVISEADAVMVARGDLGVEIGPEKVPLVQKRIIRECRRIGRPVITATQMLESMIQNPRPTRAEASDAANAILDGSDAIMLSGETAVGRHPVEAVEMLARIARDVEETGEVQPACPYQVAIDPPENSAGFIAEAVAAIAQKRGCRAIAVFTRSGSTARMMSQQRPPVPIFAFSPDRSVCRQMNLLWGVRPVLLREANDLRGFEAGMRAELQGSGDLRPGDRVALTGGHPISRHGTTNFVKLIEI